MPNPKRSRLRIKKVKRITVGIIMSDFDLKLKSGLSEFLIKAIIHLTSTSAISKADIGRAGKYRNELIRSKLRRATSDLDPPHPGQYI